MRTGFLKAVLAGILACQASLGMAAEQSRESYEDAFRTISTSPAYVLITLVDARSGQARPACVNANFLLGAIGREYELGNDAAGRARAVEIALQAKEHVFRFQRQAALDNVAVGYSDAELKAARDFLAPLSLDELKDKFSSLYANRRLDSRGYAKDAIACVLIERGLSPHVADISGQVYVGR
jgi:hypothetical protein